MLLQSTIEPLTAPDQSNALPSLSAPRTASTLYELQHSPRRGLQIGNDFLQTLSIDSKALFDRFAATQPGFSNELGFANHFIWMNRMSGFYALIEDCLCLFGLNGGVLTLMLPPMGDPDRQLDALRHGFEIMHTYNVDPEHCALELADQTFASVLGREIGSGEWLLEPQHADYVYQTQDLIELEGNSYKNKRNEINQFLRAYPDYRLEVLGEQHHDGIRRLLQQWTAERLHQLDAATLSGFMVTVEMERQGIERALHYYNELQLEGLCLIINGNIEGFTFGERINGQVASILVEKTNFAIGGAAQFLFREFSRRMADCPYTNVGDDLGLENMRRVKLSYRPSAMVEKYRLTCRR